MKASRWGCAVAIGAVVGLGCVPPQGGAGSAAGGELAPTTGTTTAAPTDAPADTTQGPVDTTMGMDASSTTEPSASSSDGAMTTTGGASPSCIEAITEEQCRLAGDDMTSCGWLGTSHVAVVDTMCVEEEKGSVCLPVSQDDDTCGLMRDPSCANGSIVFVRPSEVVPGANETLVLQPDEACGGPDPGDGWILCVPGSMVPGCRCGCAG